MCSLNLNDYLGFYRGVRAFYRIVLIHCVVFKLYFILRFHDYLFAFVLIPLAIGRVLVPCRCAPHQISTAE